MAGKYLDYWYDEQLKRYLIQLIRVFSNFRVEENTEKGKHYNRVPARYGDMSRMVASILRNNSENVINSAPFITVTIGSLQIARDRTFDPFLVDTTQVAEREYNQETDSYGTVQGNLYTTQRYMPVPYNLTINVDIWTTNTDTKMQIMEQILILFNPTLQLSQNDNPLDWTNIFELELTDITWSSRAIPAGVDEQLDIATMVFAVPIWLSPPAKVKRQSIIQQIQTDIHSVDSIEDLGFNEGYYDFFKDIADTAEVTVTPNDYYVQIAGATAILIDNASITKKWADLIEMQGELTSSSKLKLNISNDTDSTLNMITGTIASLSGNDSTLVFTLDTDTLPSNTLTNVDKIIDARANYPGDGSLAAATTGQRYLITEDISITGYPNWGVDAQANDIIEYNGTTWSVVFDASTITDNHYITNTNTTKQYRWHQNSWISSYEGIYNPGYWSLVL
jgi:general stress protein 26